MACIDPRKDPKGFVGHNTFPHHIAGKCYMTAQEFLAEFDKPAEDPDEEEAKELRAKLKTVGVTGWGPRTKLEDLRKLAEGV